MTRLSRVPKPSKTEPAHPPAIISLWRGHSVRRRVVLVPSSRRHRHLNRRRQTPRRCLTWREPWLTIRGAQGYVAAKLLGVAITATTSTSVRPRRVGMEASVRIPTQLLWLTTTTASSGACAPEDSQATCAMSRCGRSVVRVIFRLA